MSHPLGLALAGFEMAEAAGTGLALTPASTGDLFGEDQARYLLAVSPDQLATLQEAAQAADVPLTQVGSFGGDQIALGSASVPLAELATLYRTSFGRYFA